MAETNSGNCSDCNVEQLESMNRRHFFRTAGLSAAALAFGGAAAKAADTATTAVKKAKPAEALIKELFTGLSDEQKKIVVMPWDHGTKNGQGVATRLRMYNGPISKTIGDVYTPAQQDLVDQILKSISSGDEGYRQLSRDGGFDNAGTLDNCGAYIFGEPTEGKPYVWVFAGHHITVRCDGNSIEGPAFGGPMYYGHSPNGYSPKNIFFYQTKEVLSVYDALSEKQRKAAVITGTPGEHEASVKFREKGQAYPGIVFSELTADQKTLVEKVLRTLLSPYRKEDAEEVMTIVQKMGGMDKLHLAFYRDAKMNDENKWHFWRIEGPGFVWNFRVLPHVHTYVSISSKVS